MLQQVSDTAKEIAGKISPAIHWTSGYIAGLIEVPEANVHMILVFLIALWLGKFIAAEKFTGKHFIISIIIFIFLNWLGI